jgi:hypothetical protein
VCGYLDIVGVFVYLRPVGEGAPPLSILPVSSATRAFILATRDSMAY